MNTNCSNLFDMRNLQEQVKKAFCYQKLFWPSTVWINCSSDLKNFANSQPSASNFNSNCSNLLHMRNLQDQVKKAFYQKKIKSFTWSLEQFFLIVGKNNFGNKISIFLCLLTKWRRRLRESFLIFHQISWFRVIDWK